MNHDSQNLNMLKYSYGFLGLILSVQWLWTSPHRADEIPPRARSLISFHFGLLLLLLPFRSILGRLRTSLVFCLFPLPFKFCGGPFLIRENGATYFLRFILHDH